MVSGALMVTMGCVVGEGAERAEGAELDALLVDMLDEHELPAIGAVAFRGEALLYRGAVGIRAAGRPDKVTVSDKWHLGSLTKSMTATLAAMLVEEGQVRWEATLQDMLGASFAIGVAYRGVTLRDLLRHRGGFPTDTTSRFWWRLMRDEGGERDQRSRVLAVVFAMEPETPPCTVARYANLNYMVAGAMLEQASGTAWRELIQKRLFGPLEMGSAGFGPPAAGDMRGVVSQPWGHDAEGKAIAPDIRTADNPPVLGPAGTVHCSLSDLARFGAFHLRRGTLHDRSRLLAAPAFDTLHGIDQADDEWGMGWVKASRSWAGGTALSHNGTNTMNFAVIWLAPARDFGVAVVCNQGGEAARLATDEVAGALISHFLPLISTGSSR